MIYLDSSVALAQLLAEDRTPPETLWRQPLGGSPVRIRTVETAERARPWPLAWRGGTCPDRSCRPDRTGAAGARPRLGALSLFPVTVRTLDWLQPTDSGSNWMKLGAQVTVTLDCCPATYNRNFGICPIGGILNSGDFVSSEIFKSGPASSNWSYCRWRPATTSNEPCGSADGRCSCISESTDNCARCTGALNRRIEPWIDECWRKVRCGVDSSYDASLIETHVGISHRLQ